METASSSADSGHRPASHEAPRVPLLAILATAALVAAFVGRPLPALALLAATSVALLAAWRARSWGAATLVLGACTLAATFAYGLRPAGAATSLALFGAAQLGVLLVVLRGAGGSGRGRRLLGRVLVATTSVAFVASLAELVAARRWPPTQGRVHVLADSPAPSPYLPDPELVHVHAPGFRGYFTHPEFDEELFEINADGFRGAAWPDPVPEEGTRVLLLGDSVCVGFGVEATESVSGVLAAELASSVPAPALVFNAAVAGYGPRHHRAQLERLVERVRPTHVVVAFYDGNDLSDCRTQLVHARGHGLHDRRLASEGAHDAPVTQVREPAAARPPSVFGRTYWYRRCALYRRIELLWMPLLTSRGFLRHHAYVDILRDTLDPPPDDVREELDLAIEAMLAIGRRCEGLGASALVVRVPMRIQTEGVAFGELARRYGSRPERHDRTQPGRAVLAACAAAGLPTLDLLPVFEVDGRDPNPHYFREGHPNRAGHRAMAAEIARALRRGQGR